MTIGGIKIADIIVIALLILWAVLAVRYMIKRRKSGRCISCSGNCQCCKISKANCKTSQKG